MPHPPSITTPLLSAKPLKKKANAPAVVVAEGWMGSAPRGSAVSWEARPDPASPPRPLPTRVDGVPCRRCCCCCWPLPPSRPCVSAGLAWPPGRRGGGPSTAQASVGSSEPLTAFGERPAAAGSAVFAAAGDDTVAAVVAQGAAWAGEGAKNNC